MTEKPSSEAKARLASQLTAMLNQIDFSTASVEEIQYRAARLLRTFLQDDASLLADLKPLPYFSRIDADQIADFFAKLQHLLGTTSERMEDAMATIADSYNQLAASGKSLVDEVATLQSALNTAKLFQGNGTSWAEVSNDLSAITPSAGSTLTVDSEKRVVTLPIAEDTNLAQQIADIQILPVSNGTPGNNHVVGRAKNASIQALVDGSQDTMFEYEKIGTGEPVRLAIQVTFKSPTIVNKIRLFPVMFGATEPPKLVDIYATTNDGKTQIQPDVPLPIPLSILSSSNTATHILYLFPTLADSITMVFEQDSAYPIVDRYGAPRMRKVIAFRDMTFHSTTYEQSGQLELPQVTPGAQVTQIAWDVDGAFLSMGTAHLLLRLNDEPDAHEIAPLSAADGTAEILHVNDPGYSESVYLNAPLGVVKPTLTLARTPLRQTIAATPTKRVEFVDAPWSAPYEIPLSSIPVPNSVRVIIPAAIGVGTGKRWVLGESTGEAGQIFTWAFAGDIQGMETIYVNGSAWNRVDSLATVGATPAYMINYDTRSVSFGDGTNGLIPPAGAQITMSLDADTPDLSFDGSVTTIKLSLLPSNYRDVDVPDLELHNVLGTKSVTSTLQFNGRQSTLPDRPATPDSVTISGWSRTPYIDGLSEFSAGGQQFSVEPYTGTIYLSVPYDGPLTVAYEREDVTAIQVVSRDGDMVTVNAADVVLMTAPSVSAQLDKGVIVLPHRQIVPNSVTLSASGDEASALQDMIEVPFQNGLDEFEVYQEVEEAIPANKTEFVLSHIPVVDADHPLVFSDRIVFAKQLQSNVIPATMGEFIVITDTVRNRTIVRTATPTRGGTIRYSRRVSDIDPDRCYSVDTKNGRIYFRRSFANTRVTASYMYANVKARYVAAHELPATLYTVSNAGSIQLKKLSGIRELATWPSPLAVEYVEASRAQSSTINLDNYISPVVKEVKYKWI